MSTFSKSNRNYKYKRLPDSGDYNGRNAVESLQDGDLSDHSEAQRRTPPSRGESSNKDLALSVYPKYEEIIERPNKPGESLTSISLKYRIPVSELKRINKIQKDVEFFALSSLKIPIKCNSALMDILNDELSQSTPSNNANPTSTSHVKSYEQIINDREASRVLLTRDSFSENDDEFYDLWIPQESKWTIMGPGADWGLKWWFVLLLGAFVLIVIPILCYLYYYYEEQ